MSELIYPRLKEVFLGADEPAAVVDLISHPFVEGAEIFYVLDRSDDYLYLTSDDLETLGVDIGAVRELSLQNLGKLLAGRGSFTRYSNGLVMITELEGFESSLLLLPSLMLEFGIERSTSCFAVPLRDVLIFCSAHDIEARGELERVAKRIFDKGSPSHRMSDRLLVVDRGDEAGYALLSGGAGLPIERLRERTSLH